MTTQRGRHRKLRRNILHTVIATALLAGTFTVVDQTVSSQTSPASANTAGGNDTTWNSAIVTAGAPTATVADTAIDTSGNVYVAFASKVVKYSSAGAVVYTSPDTTGTITAIALDNSNNLLVGTTSGARLLSANGATWTNWSGATSSVTAVAFQPNAFGANNNGYWIAQNSGTSNARIAGYQSVSGGLYLGSTQFNSNAGIFTSTTTTNETIYELVVDSANALHMIGNFPKRYVKFPAGAAGWALTSYSAIQTALSTPATNLAISGTNIAAFGGPTGMGRVRVFSTATAAGAETTTFGNLSSSSTVTSAITTDLAVGSSDLAFDASGRLLVGGQTFGLK